MQSLIERNVEMIQQSRAAQGLDAKINFHVITDETTRETLMQGGFVVQCEYRTGSITECPLNGKTGISLHNFVLAVPNTEGTTTVTRGDVIAVNDSEFWYCGEYGCKWYNLKITQGV